MNNYLPELRQALLDAAHRQSGAVPALPHHREQRVGAWWHSSRLRWVAMNVGVGVLVTLVGLTATGAFQQGAAVGPDVRPMPTAGLGVAIKRSVKLLPVRAADPAGGLPWGLRVVRTTRGVTCVAVGRVDFGTVGVLGIDGAFDDDGRFHPLSDDVYDQFDCGNIDAHGHAFFNVALEGVPTSGLTDDAKGAGGCQPTEPGSTNPRERRACPVDALREIYYGLLGPDAVSVTHRTASGALERTPTVGPDGAYLIVLRQPMDGCIDQESATRGSPSRPRCPYAWTGTRGGAKVPPGAITAVTYRDGRTCHVAPRTERFSLGSCPPVGFVSPAHRRLTAPQVATPVHVSTLPGTSVCVARASSVSSAQAFKSCAGRVPKGYERIAQPSTVVQISYRSRVAIDSDRGHYQTNYFFPRSKASHCDDGGGMATGIDSNVRAGELLSERQAFPLDCPGVVRGEVDYVSTPGPDGRPTELTGANKLLVGRFSFRVR